MNAKDFKALNLILISDKNIKILNNVFETCKIKQKIFQNKFLYFGMNDNEYKSLKVGFVEKKDYYFYFIKNYNEIFASQIFKKEQVLNLVIKHALLMILSS